MLKFSKKLMAVISAAALLSSAVVLTSCKDEDENNALDGYSISYGHPSDATVSYSRSWNVTHTNHLSADCTITIDRTSKTTNTKGTTGLTTTTDGGNNAAYIFGLTGSGSETSPYSFGLIGFRLSGTTPQYFISYYTGVLSSDCNSDANDFDTASNNAAEYVLVSAWTDLDPNAYTLTSDALSVYVDLDALSGTTVVTKDNYSTLKDSMDAYQIKIAKDGTSSAAVTKTLNVKNVKADTEVKKPSALTKITVEQARLGFYAMVSKGKALVAKLDFNNDSIVKSVVSEPTDDFGKPIDLYGEVLTNIK